jgi:hypothetical protein
MYWISAGESPRMAFHVRPDAFKSWNRTPMVSLIGGGVCASSAMLEGRGSSDAPVLVFVNLVSLAAVAAYGINVNRKTATANHKLFILAWHLGKLLPSERVSLRSISTGKPS